MGQDNRKKKLNSKLPLELIFEILSWLIIEPLLRMQCVCKDWYALIRDPKFIVTQFDRASNLQKIPDQLKKQLNSGTVCTNADEFYLIFASSFGLFLEMSVTNSRCCRIRNPMTRQVVYLPDHAHEGAFMTYDFALNRFTAECKVVCYYSNGERESGFQVFTVGVDEQWRKLKHPMQELLEQGKLFGDDVYIRARDGIGHLCVSVKDGEYLQLEGRSLDIWNECFTFASSLPRGVFEVDGERVRQLVRWNEYCVAVAEIGDEDLSVLVLEDYKNNKWSERKIVVPLQFLRDEPELKDQIMSIMAYSDVLRLSTESETIHYDMKKQEVIITEDKKPFEDEGDEGETSCWLRPTLMTLKGMKPEE